jgi:hypothetical protein
MTLDEKLGQMSQSTSLLDLAVSRKPRTAEGIHKISATDNQHYRRYSYMPRVFRRSDLLERLVQRLAMIPERGFVSRCLSR